MHEEVKSYEEDRLNLGHQAVGGRCDTYESATRIEGSPPVSVYARAAMTHTHFRIIAAAGLFSLTLRAADAIEVHWDHLCAAADGKKLSIARSDGSTVEGYCMSINVNEVLIRTPDRGMVKIARSTLSRLHMSGEKKHHLASLGKGFDKGLRKGFNWLLSTHALLGVVTIPATVGWGAFSLPFCALGDLKDKMSDPEHVTEIKVI